MDKTDYQDGLIGYAYWQEYYKALKGKIETVSFIR